MRMKREHFERLIRHNHLVTIKERKIILGYRDGHAVFASPGSLLIGGQSGMGKSHILAFLSCGAVIAGARLLVFDPHCNEPEDGLLKKIEPLRPWFIRDPVDFEDPEEVLALFEWLEQEYRSRQARNGMDGKQPLYIIIDEFNEMLTLFDIKQVQALGRIIGNLARGGRKFGMFLCICAHNWNLDASGGSSVRKNIAGGRIAVGCESGDVSLILNVHDTKLISQLCTPPLDRGDAVVKPQGSAPVRVHFPVNGPDHCRAVAELVCETVGIPRFPLVQLPGNETSHRTSESVAQTAGAPDVGGVSVVSRNASSSLMACESPLKAPLEKKISRFPGNEAKSAPYGQKETGKRGKQVPVETQEEIIRLHIQGRPHREIIKHVGLQGKQYDRTYKPLCEMLGLSLDPKAPMTDAEWHYMKQYYAWTCLSCGRSEPEITLEADHKVPRSQGGPDCLKNRQPLCSQCNKIKGVKIVDYTRELINEIS